MNRTSVRPVLPRASLLLLLVCAPTVLLAATDPTPRPDEEYEKKLHAAQTVSPLGSDFAGEDVSLYDGSTTFSVTDVDLPGNDGLPVRIGRKLKIVDRHGEGNLPGFGDWDLDLPRIEGTFLSDRGWKLQGDAPYARCSSQALPDVATDGVVVGPRDVWSGTNLYIPGAGTQELLVNDQAKVPAPTDGQAYPWITENFTHVRCLQQTASGYPGEAFVAVTPDGTKYTFDYVVTYPARSIRVPLSSNGIPHIYETTTFSSELVGLPRVHVAFLPTTVEDRFGNTVTYHYSGSSLTSITSSDGRRIDLTWDGDHISQVTTKAAAPASDRNWVYAYTPVTGNGYRYAYQLASVTQPDATQWTYSAVGTLMPVREAPLDGGQNTKCPVETDALNDFDGYHLTIGHPSGATVAFDFEYARSYRAHTPIKQCRLPIGEQAPSPYAAHYWDGYQLQAKTISGPGMAQQRWTYAIGSGATYFYTSGAPTDPCPACQQTKVTTVTAPDGSYKRYTFGDMYGINDGKLLQVDEGKGTDAPLRTTTTQYIATSDVPAQRFSDEVGSSRNLVYSMNTRLRPVVAKTIAQDGVSFQSLVPATNGVYALDAFGRPTSELKQSSLGSKTDTTTYFDDLGKWVLGQVATVTTAANGKTKQVSRTVYDSATDLPVQYFAFGKLQHTLSYDPDGTLATIQDGNGSQTSLSSWKRGIPQVITYPATPDSPAGAVESATVDDNGWVRSTTDENRYTTGYGYDAMGRVSSIVYPSGDSTAWNTTLVNFAPVANPEFGIEAGHWKQTITSGNAVKATYFDALLRPLVVQEYDAANVPATQRVTRHAYDTAGREAFTSYPGTTDGLSSGIRKLYDALGRVTEVDQDSELGTLVTTTEYLAGFRTRTTNPRLYQTTTSFLAYEEPTTEWPVNLVQPEGVQTDIERDAFGKPTAITRHDAANTISLSRRFLYDANELLCKTIEPETGISVSRFDGANNLSWSASAQPLNDTDCSDVASVPANARVMRTYDARNRLLSLDFPDDWSDTT